MGEAEDKARNRLKTAREAAGMYPSELAAFVGHSQSAYLDLENCEGEIFMNIDLGNLAKLCSALGLRPHQLFDSTSRSVSISSKILCQQIRDRVTHLGISVSAFSDRVNYDIHPALLDSNEVLNWNIDCLKNVCEELSLNWIQALPD